MHRIRYYGSTARGEQHGGGSRDQSGRVLSPRLVSILRSKGKEGEDALDGFAGLVERDIADWETDTASSTTTDDLWENDNIKLVAKAYDLNENGATQAFMSPSSSSSSPTFAISSVMRTTKEENPEDGFTQISQITDDLFDTDSALYGTNKRRKCSHHMEMIEELIKPYAYAEELKRAAASASAWLLSIAMGQTTCNHGLPTDDEEMHDVESTTTSTIAGGAEINEKDQNSSNELDKMYELLTDEEEMHDVESTTTSTNASGAEINDKNQNSRNELDKMYKLLTDDEEETHDDDESTTTSTIAAGAEINDKNQNSSNELDKMEIFTLKEALNSAQLSLTKTDQANSILNEELSKCRAEIGRMKSISRSEVSIISDSLKHNILIKTET